VIRLDTDDGPIWKIHLDFDGPGTRIGSYDNSIKHEFYCEATFEDNFTYRTNQAMQFVPDVVLH
jgi:hypothetical protein